MLKNYHVQRSVEERQLLESLIYRGHAPARAQIHARILLKADGAKGQPAWTDWTSRRVRWIPNVPWSASMKPASHSGWRGWSRAPLPPGQPQRDESSYARNGVSNLVMGFAPLLNGRHVKEALIKSPNWEKRPVQLIDLKGPHPTLSQRERAYSELP